MYGGMKPSKPNIVSMGTNATDQQVVRVDNNPSPPKMPQRVVQQPPAQNGLPSKINAKKMKT